MKCDDVELIQTAVRVSQYPTDELPEFLILGRSNVGKSSFINAVTNRKSIARTSATPGKTQTLNFYLIDKMVYLVDVPGYGYAKVNKEKKEKFGLMIEEYIKNRKELKHIFLLVDYRHKPSQDDLLMYDYLKYYNLPVTIVCTKFDKVKKSLQAKQDKLINATLDLAETDNIVRFSSVTKQGKEEIYNVIKQYL